MARDEVAQYFYSYLFLRYPQTRDMFPPAMTKQRDRSGGRPGAHRDQRRSGRSAGARTWRTWAGTTASSAR